MPFPRRLFDMNVNPECERVMREAYNFLSENRELAYARDEIEEKLTRLISFEGSTENIERALDTLSTLAAIRSRKIDGTHYYAFGQEFDTGTWISRRHSTGE